MEKATRSLIQDLTQKARQILEADFAAQLEGDHNILPSGEIKAQAGEHLSPLEKSLRRRMVEAIEHQMAGGLSAKVAIERFVREAAFTCLNRFVALKMLEARKLTQECVSRGEQSSGFREFCGLAEGLNALPDRGYRLYLECLFDELGTEVQALFDRREANSLLWPRRPALLGLLEHLNAEAIASIWGQDETIGWVYQYFNADAERKAMREASAAPRNSRELAVRNQFFTPRYVVEFLTDNTLGRLWYDMCKGQSGLSETCEYLVIQPNEVLKPRERKDPRSLKVLDPACGSGHFLLYAFDLFLVIYREDWENAGPLKTDYPELAQLQAELPALILRHNLFGVDIDPRAAQIAAFALWMRAQRAWQDFGLPAAQRPLVKKTNIVVAEPMPGESDLLAAYLGDLKEAYLRSLIQKVFEQMKLAGEAGLLLRIEESFQNSMAEMLGNADGFLAPARENYWKDSEGQVLQALEAYAKQASAAEGLRRQLFAEDAARGFALVDLARQRYDVILMNPPFGASGAGAKRWLDGNYPRSKNDLYAMFVERGLELLNDRGRLGAITSRTGFFLTTFKMWREEILLKEAHLEVMADLGHGVLDAMVETAAYCLEKVST
jgi:hypothetical protein